MSDKKYFIKNIVVTKGPPKCLNASIDAEVQGHEEE
jgi:hypothetical protein